MPYSGMTSLEVCALLGMNRQMLQQSGVGDAIPKQFPFGPRYPLYDEHESRMWRDALNRRKALIAFGRLSEKASLLDATKIDPSAEMDCECSQCHGWAYAESLDFQRAWCPMHGTVNL